MGATNSTRRIIVEEDEKHGAFLVQVSDSVTKQIFGSKEPGGKVAKKHEPIHEAVEALPTVKPALPIQAFPTLPLGSPSPPLASPKRKIATPPESTAKVEEKKEKPTIAETADSVIELAKGKTPEDHVAPEAAAAAAKEPTPTAKKAEPTAKESTPTAEAVLEEKKPAEVPPEPAADVPVEQAPLAPPKIPRSAILQLLSPSRTPPSEPEAPVTKESPVKKEEAPAPPLVPSDKALSEERELLYKQMGEVYRERDKALKSIEDFYREKMSALQNQSTKMHSATRQEFNKAVEEVEKKFLKHVEAPVCEDLQLKVLDCYRVNKAHPLNCSSEVQAFSSAVDQARQNVILAKKG